MKVCIFDEGTETDIEVQDESHLEEYLQDMYAGYNNTTEWYTVQVAYANDDGTYDLDAEGNKETESCDITIHPTEPSCSGEEHNWSSDHSLVGGCKENPGVFGHGGGVTCTVICTNCGLRQIEDSWAQRPDTGEQGLSSVTYDDSNCSTWEAEEELHDIIG